MDEQLEELKDLSKDDLQTLTTREILDYVEAVEQCILEEHGKLVDRNGDHDLGKIYDVEADVADNFFRLLRVLRKRLSLADRYLAHEENCNEIEKLQEQTDGM